MKVYKFKCESCGSTKYEKTNDKAYRCAYCGCIEEVQSDKTEESKILIRHKKEARRKLMEYDGKISNVVIRLVVCVIFGTFGVHRFMERKILTGLLYVFTFGLFGFGVFFDIIKYVFRIINLAKMRRYHSEELMEIEGGVGDHE